MKTLKQTLLATALIIPGLAMAHNHMGDHGMHNPQGMGNPSMQQGAPMQPGAMNHGQMMSHGTQVGRAGRPQDVKRTFQIDMHDQKRFTPNEIEVNAGETVRFFVRNAGQHPHDFVIGTREELQQHARMMHQQQNMVHNDPNMVSLKPRQRGGVIWQFDQPGTYYFGCLQQGHFDEGMMGKIIVK
jgi:uncharacterized cupredoxin-like copper-binding protein